MVFSSRFGTKSVGPLTALWIALQVKRAYDRGNTGRAIGLAVVGVLAWKWTAFGVVTAAVVRALRGNGVKSVR